MPTRDRPNGGSIAWDAEPGPIVEMLLQKVRRDGSTIMVEDVRVGIQQIESAVGDIFPGAAINLRQIRGGLSETAVFRASLSSAEGFEHVDYILKVGRAATLHGEAKRYRTYIDGLLLKASHHASVEPSLDWMTRLKDADPDQFAALAYRAVGQQDFGQFVIGQIRADNVVGALDSVEELLEILRAWQRQGVFARKVLTAPATAESPIGMYGFLNVDQAVKDFSRVCAGFSADLPAIPPERVMRFWTSRLVAQRTYVAPGHGDLHHENIRIDDGSVVLIDFGGAEQGHFLRDLVTLEAHLIIRALCPADQLAASGEDAPSPPSDEQREFFTRVRELYTVRAFTDPFHNLPDDDAELAPVLLLRRYAHATLMRGDPRLAGDYAFGLLRHAIRLANRADDGSFGRGQAWCAARLAYELSGVLDITADQQIALKGQMRAGTGLEFLQPRGRWDNLGLQPVMLLRPTPRSHWDRLSAALLGANTLHFAGIAPWPLLNALIEKAPTVPRLPAIHYTTTPRPLDDFHAVRWDNSVMAIRNLCNVRSSGTMPISRTVVTSASCNDDCLLFAEWPDGERRIFSTFGASPQLPDGTFPYFLSQLEDDANHHLSDWIRQLFTTGGPFDIREIECDLLGPGFREQQTPLKLRLHGLAPYGAGSADHTLRPIAVVLPQYRDNAIMFVRHQLCDSDAFGRLSFPSARIRPEDIAARHGFLMPRQYFSVNREIEWLERSVGVAHRQGVAVDIETLQHAGSRAFFKCTGVRIPPERFIYHGLHVDESSSGRRREIGYAVLKLDLTTTEMDECETADRRMFNSVVRLLRVVPVPDLLTGGIRANGFTDLHREWMAEAAVFSEY